MHSIWDILQNFLSASGILWHSFAGDWRIEGPSETIAGTTGTWSFHLKTQENTSKILWTSIYFLSIFCVCVGFCLTHSGKKFQCIQSPGSKMINYFYNSSSHYFLRRNLWNWNHCHHCILTWRSQAPLCCSPGHVRITNEEHLASWVAVCATKVGRDRMESMVILKLSWNNETRDYYDKWYRILLVLQHLRIELNFELVNCSLGSFVPATY